MRTFATSGWVSEIAARLRLLVTGHGRCRVGRVRAHIFLAIICVSKMNKQVHIPAEFLGDASMDFVVGTFLYHYRPRATPGEMTIWKQQTSRNGIQATIAYYHGFHKVICYESPRLFKVCICSLWFCVVLQTPPCCCLFHGHRPSYKAFHSSGCASVLRTSTHSPTLWTPW